MKGRGAMREVGEGVASLAKLFNLAPSGLPRSCMEPNPQGLLWTPY